jgi:hypothetical protein
MLTVKVKSKEHAFTVPVPYAILHMGSGILTSNWVHRLIKDRLKKRSNHTDAHLNRKHGTGSDNSQLGIELMLSIFEDPSTKQTVRQLIKELERCRGTILVDVQAHDGTEVLIKL